MLGQKSTRLKTTLHCAEFFFTHGFLILISTYKYLYPFIDKIHINISDQDLKRTPLESLDISSN